MSGHPPQAALDYSARHAEQVLIVAGADGTAYERYAAGWNGAKAHALYSGTKSFWGVLALSAQSDGLLDLDEQVATTVPEWRAEAWKARLRLRELLDLTSGFPFGGLGAAVPTYENALATPLRDAPGTAFTYGGIPLQVFGAVLARKLAARALTPHDYLRARVLDGAEVAVASWRALKDGTHPLPTGAFLTPHHWLAYGRFVLAAGSSGALAPCFTGSAPNPRYGLGFWLHRTKSGVDVAYASGSGGQALYVAWQPRSVTVRFSSGGSYAHETFLARLFP